MGQVWTSTGLGLQDSQTQVSSCSTRKEGRTICSLLILRGSLPPQTLRACEHLHTYKGRVVLREATSTTADTDRHLHKWQQQNFWIHFPDSLALLEKPATAVSAYTQAHMSEARTSSHFSEKKKAAPASFDRPPHSRRPTQWDSTEDPVVPLVKHVRSPIGRVAVGREARTSTSQGHVEGNYQLGKVFNVHPTSCPYMWTTSR